VHLNNTDGKIIAVLVTEQQRQQQQAEGTLRWLVCFNNAIVWRQVN
jgi:hypothetical protein